VFGSGTSDSTLATNGHSSTTGGFVGALVGGGGNEVEVEATLGVSSVLEYLSRFFADRFLVRERKGKRDVFWGLALRRAGSAAVGSSSGCINWGRRGFEEDEAETSAMVE